METNTVVLRLSDYNQLREFKEKMEEGNTYKLPQPFVYGGGSYVMGESYPKTTYITTDSAVAELLERNTHLSALNEELMNECNRLRLEDRPYNSKLVNKLAKMSIWEFIKWRKAQ
jgi:hypothetical protein